MIKNIEGLKANISEYIENNYLDMMNEFDDEEVERIVLNLCSRMSRISSGSLYINRVKGKLVADSIAYNGYDYTGLIKWNNSSRAFISYSTHDGTGVSNCICKLDPEENYDYIIDMVNEAWYRCNN